MKYSELDLKNSLDTVKKDIDELKIRNSLMDTKLKNSFFNIKRDMDFLKESIEKIKTEKEDFSNLEHLGDRLSKISSAIENIRNVFSKESKTGFFKDIKTVVTKTPENNLKEIKTSLKDLEKARKSNSHNFESSIYSLKEDVNSKLRELETKIPKPVTKDFENSIGSLKEDIASELKNLEKKIPEQVTKEVIKEEVVKEEPIEVTVQEEKKEVKEEKKGKNIFTKMIDFFAED